MEEWSVCRLCLQSREEPLKYVSGTLHNSLPYRSIYFTVIGISLTDYKSFPTQICTRCEENMINAYSFREKCLETEEKLRELESWNMVIPEVNLDIAGKSLEEKVHELHERDENVDCLDATEDFRNEQEAEFREEQEARKILCKRCKLVFRGFETFRKHKCRKERKIQSIKPKETKPCNICGKEIKGSHYVQHMDYHNGIKRYECEYCGEKFYWWTARRTHIYKEHLKKKVCKCPYCPKEFYITGQMNIHIKQLHSDNPDYQCEKCGKEFKVERSLKKHLLTHVEGGVCNYCGKIYNNRLRLIKHLKIHGNREKADCPICSKTLRTISILRSHFKKMHPDQMHLFPGPKIS
ncbi:putative zinc finger protein 730 [Phlebotomus papatasi]|uniref:putative zinc finger protein 730 n=1 Tax=Phlebotomus papatasi TaxID=29031 RepID=UPI002483D26D|nr:putative zinc finger protein 730 [Phlebotomus papatasi]